MPTKISPHMQRLNRLRIKRLEAVIELRRQGKSYSEIGAKLGVSRQRAEQIAKAAGAIDAG